jgi:hypothetical protein
MFFHRISPKVESTSGKPSPLADVLCFLLKIQQSATKPKNPVPIFRLPQFVGRPCKKQRA